MNTQDFNVDTIESDTFIAKYDHKYTTYNYNYDTLFANIEPYFSNIYEFLNIINSNKNISISGSSILEVINNKKFDTNENKKSDIDIYINILKLNNMDFNKILSSIYTFLQSEGYVAVPTEHKYILRTTRYGTIKINPNFDEEDPFNIKNIKINARNTFLERYYDKNNYYNMRYCKKYNTKIYKYNHLNENISIKEWDGYALNKHLLDYYKFENKERNKLVEIMFINQDINDFMINTFDLSVIKNYYSMSEIKVYNLWHIKSKTAVINYRHFYKRILNNNREFENFLIRYQKYKSRGYQIRIENVILTDEIVDKIKDMFLNYKYIFSYNNMKKLICICTDDSICNHKYKKYVPSNLLIASYINNKYEEAQCYDANANQVIRHELIDDMCNFITNYKLLKSYQPSNRRSKLVMCYLIALKLNQYSKYE